MAKRVVVFMLLVLGGGAGLYAAVVLIRAQSGLSAGQEMLAHQLWPQARGELARYLWLHPSDDRARLLMAEALVKDEALPAVDAAVQAIDYLAEIPDSSPLAAEARLQQARLCLLILHKPARAERLLRSAIELAEDDLPAYQLLWTVLNVTGRAELGEPIFWRVYELSPEQERPLRLREWYMSQFFPLTANEFLDRMMGILSPDERPTKTTESRRYLRFRAAEPEAPVNHAAAAQWCQLEGDPKFAVQLLDAAAGELPAAQSDPFFLAVSIAARLDLGQFDEAEACFRGWPENDRGHLYWRSRAAILDDVTGQHEAALEAYDRAVDLWPGHIDWRLHYRRAGCLARLSLSEEAEAARDRAKELQALMNADVHERLRKLLGFLDEPEPLNEVVQFYDSVGRDREAECWREYVQRLQAAGAGYPQRESSSK